MRRTLALAAALAALACSRAPQGLPARTAAAVAARPQELPLLPYAPAQEVAGEVVSIGSDSMDPLLRLWWEDFQKRHPRAHFAITSKGSATAPKALAAGTTLLGHMSREMTPEELTAFQARHGYAPTRVVVAVDALAIYVNANNPIRQLHMKEVDGIFSSTRKGGLDREVATWGDLGLSGEWQGRQVQAVGRDENSGTRAFFREHALLKGEYKATVQAMPDQWAVVERPATDPHAVSYGPIQYAVGMVKAVPLVAFDGTAPVAPSLENILGGRYPLTRFLYLYVDRAPGRPLDPAVREFLSFVLSKEGQASVASFGAIPLPGDMARAGLAKLN